jgi:ribosomal-protein-alanine N-acetyltransferase
VNKKHQNDFIIRNYRKGDFEGISKVWAATDMGNPLRGDDEKTIEKSIDTGGSMIIMEEKKSSLICGTSWLTYDGRRIYLHHFGILPQFQGRNLSKLLMDESLKFVKMKGVQVKLEVHRTNRKAVNIYKKAGFTYLGDYDVYIIRDISTIKI